MKRNKRFIYNEVKEYIELFGYTLLSEKYVNARTKIKIKCKHGHIQEVTLNSFKTNNGGCRKCADLKEIKRKRYTIKEIDKYLNDANYTLLSKDYTCNKDKLLIKCDKGHIFEMSFSKFKNANHRCPECNVSKGENKIDIILHKNNIKHIHQYKIDDCKNIYSLPFDFYLEDYDVLIEYQGEQHFEPIKYFGGIEKFKKQIINDSIKKYYCIENNIKLIQIPYWEFDNIKYIMKEIMNKQN